MFVVFLYVSFEIKKKQTLMLEFWSKQNASCIRRCCRRSVLCCNPRCNSLGITLGELLIQHSRVWTTAFVEHIYEQFLQIKKAYNLRRIKYVLYLTIQEWWTRQKPFNSLHSHRLTYINHWIATGASICPRKWYDYTTRATTTSHLIQSRICLMVKKRVHLQ